MTERSEAMVEESGERRSTPQLVRSIAGDTAELVRKEVQLARQELTEGIAAKAQGVAAFVVAGVLMLMGVIYLGFAAAAGLERVLPDWAALLVVFGGFAIAAALGVAIGMARMRKPGPRLEETNRTVKEDVEWAKAQLKR